MNTRYNIKTVVLLAALITMSACSESYPGIDYDLSQGGAGMVNLDETSEYTPIMLFANQQDFFAVSTRGTGPFEPLTIEKKLEKARFHVFSFRKGTYSLGPANLQRLADFRNYSHAKNSIGGTRDTLDCLVDGHEYMYGTPTFLTYGGVGLLVPDTLNSWTEDDAYFYNSTYTEVPYNFFAYYIDDLGQKANWNPHRDKDSIWYEMTIDGMQDVLCGYAPLLTEEVLKTQFKEQYETLSRNEINKICSSDVDGGGYCTFTAHRRIHPHIQMKHQFSQFTFLAYPGDSTANNIVIDRIDVSSQINGRLVVACHDLSKVGFHPFGAQTKLSVMDPSDGVTPPGPMSPSTMTYDKTKKDESWLNQVCDTLGGGIMLCPQNKYEMVIHYRQNLTPTSATPTWKNLQSVYELKLDTDALEAFKAGMRYTVRIAVFGLRKIEVYTSMEGWKPGEKEIDFGDEWE